MDCKPKYFKNQVEKNNVTIPLSLPSLWRVVILSMKKSQPRLYNSSVAFVMCGNLVSKLYLSGESVSC